MSYPGGAGYGAGYPYYPYYNPGLSIPQAPPVVPQQRSDFLALQMRIVRAKQINVLCKQKLVQDHLLNSRVSTQPVSTERLIQGRSENSVSKSYIIRKPEASESFMPTEMQSRPRASGHNSNEEIIAKSNASNENNISASENQSLLNKPLPAEPLPDNHNLQPRFADDDDDDAIPVDQSAPAPRRSDQEDVKLLNTLAESLTKTVADSGVVLKKLNAKKNRLPPAEKAKKKIEHMIKLNANAPAVMPLWRHKLNGRPDPPPETILKGKRLFRLIVKSLLILFIKPTVAVLKRKLSLRESERKDLQKTLKLVASSFMDWLGKLIQLPTTSVAQDETLNFEPTESLVLNTQPLKTRMLQLKVRLRGVVMGIAKSDMPSDFLTDSLITLIEDNNYFAAGVLWDGEVDRLEFNSLGATRNVAPEVDRSAASTSAGAPGSRQSAKGRTADANIVSISVEDSVSLGSGSARHTTVAVDASRVRMMLQNFLFVRTVVAHLLLSPWACSLCAAPSQRSAKRVIYNHRVLATTMYELLRHIDATLPAVPDNNSAAKTAGAPHVKEKFIVQKRPAGSLYVLGDAMIAEARRTQVLTPSPSAAMLPGLPVGPSTKGAAVSAGALAATMAGSLKPTPRVATASGSKRPGAAEGANSSEGTAAAAPLPSIAEDATAGAEKNENDADSPPAAAAPVNSSLLGKLSRLMGMSDTTPGVEALSQGSIESRLLEPREEFTSQTELHGLLISPTQLAPLKAYWDAWFAELKGPLEVWLQRLVVHVLTRKLKQKREREEKEAAAIAAANS